MGNGLGAQQEGEAALRRLSAIRTARYAPRRVTRRYVCAGHRAVARVACTLMHALMTLCAAIGAMSCLDWVPQKSIRHPASCPLAAGQARALAGWPPACIQSVSDLCMMHA